MLDETDVCARIVKSSKRIITVPDAYVFHKYAPSATRTHERIPKSLMAPARSKAYFCFKHSTSTSENLMKLDVIAEIERYRKDVEFSNKWFLDHRKISPAHYSRLSRELAAGIADGMRIAISQVPDKPTPRSPDAARSAPLHSMSTFTRVQSLPVPARVLKIYLVSQGYPPADTAGIARWTHECALELSAIGHEVHVITRNQGAANYVDFRDGVWIHSVMDAFDDDFSYSAPVPIPASVARRATAVLREIQRAEPIWGVDLVSAPIWDVEGILCCAHLDKPVVVSLHTTYKLAMQFKPEWKSDLRYKAKHVDKVIAAEAWLLANARAILANSTQVISEIDENYDGILCRRAARVTTVWHGIGTPVVTRDKSPAVDTGCTKKLKILFVGRIEERKGPDQLLSALAQMSTTLEKVEVYFVGSPPNAKEPYGLKVARQADALRRKHPRLSLQFPGYVTDSELQQHYSSADVFVAPSRFESFGLVLIEAMRHGLPVVACDAGGMREIISDGVNGYLVKLDDANQLAGRLTLLVENSEIRGQMADSAKQTYESRFTARKMAQSIEKMFSELIEECIDE
jgi:glycogen synthase